MNLLEELMKPNQGAFHHGLKWSSDPFAKKEWRKAEYQKHINIKAAMLKELGIENHPKADKAWELAWARSHSEGYYQVFYTLEELVELMK